MSAPQSAKVNGREHAIQQDADDPLRDFRKEFLIPNKIRSGMSPPLLRSSQYTYWQLPTATTAMVLAFTSAETL